MNKEQRTMNCFTLVEMLIVVGIIALLTTMVIGIAARIDNKAKQQLTESTIAILTVALEQFADFGYNYRHSDYSEFDFPLDCNGFDDVELAETLDYAFGLTIGTTFIDSVDGSFNHLVDYSGGEALYFFLSRVPESRKTLDKIDKSLTTNRDEDGSRMRIDVDGEEYPLLRIVDPWNRTLRYDYCEDLDYPEDRRTFPVITSAGPDGIFDTDDDITNR
jgi:type II secretory pathway pseudopilin PulG